MPAFNSPPKNRQLFRFQMTSTSNSRININRIQMIGLKVFCNTATSCYAAWTSVKIRAIVMVPPNALDTSGSVANNDVDLIWGGVTSDGSALSKVNNSTVPQAQLFIPPMGSAASYPTNIINVSANPTSAAAGDGAEILFSVFATPGAYLDVYVTVVEQDQPAVLNLATLSGLVQGSTFWLGLDNLFVAGLAHVWDTVGKRQTSN